MSNDQIIRAWKDESYRASLSEHERSQLPPHPAGLVEVSDSQLNGVSGAGNTNTYTLWVFTCHWECHGVSIYIPCPQ